ncbi:hypothetical protein NIASO_11460 [Niabella soli DSM 19437]|uniref:Uncharacterized protein n=1 Tax=Niabella soli DSM 19437 TaxID=929713 RepID=W0F3L8_9BACT|nr:hypothetical protein NIASO_11460 [Niabella soli DSM 19437]
MSALLHQAFRIMRYAFSKFLPDRFTKTFFIMTGLKKLFKLTNDLTI